MYLIVDAYPTSIFYLFIYFNTIVFLLSWSKSSAPGGFERNKMAPLIGFVLKNNLMAQVALLLPSTLSMFILAQSFMYHYYYYHTTDELLLSWDKIISTCCFKGE